VEIAPVLCGKLSWPLGRT